MMLVDCTTCPVRHVRCADCMVSALMTVPLARPETPRPDLTEAGSAVDTPNGLALDRAERQAVSVLLAAGLVSVGEANSARAVRSEAPAHGAGSSSSHQDPTRPAQHSHAASSERSAGSARAAG